MVRSKSMNVTIMLIPTKILDRNRYITAKKNVHIDLITLYGKKFN